MPSRERVRKYFMRFTLDVLTVDVLRRTVLSWSVAVVRVRCVVNGVVIILLAILLIPCI